ncbi:glutamate receptor 2.5-like protein isoform X1 [Cinnamomum micranthum f. kanehirae]|uniref:Glutamate receptor 2.5-like protein isoform X1 n=1 Tax=Cinnamomum micranthum f. kanehirae TaxID=337451 RepID=A0A3S3MWN2_9MAGN|nr:glutamate receptor 2.5-like protein isoform X1 [Cinnamomum micranthum f. kanehirae]
MNEAEFPYFVSLAPNVYSYERGITNPSPENERNMKSSPSLASHEYFVDMNNRMEAFGRDKLIINHEQASVEVVGNAIVTTATLNCSEFIGEGDFMEMNTMDDHTYLALFLFTIFCLCCLSIFMTQYFPGKLVDKGTTGCHQDVKKSEIFISMLLSITTVLLILGTGNSRSQLEGGILKSNYKFKGIHLTRTIFAVAANLPYKVSGKFYRYENHMDNKGYYDEPNDKNGRTDVKLRMLIPMKNTFHEFVKVDLDPKGNGMTATGFSVDLFKEAMDHLPYRVSYEFIPYESTDSLDMGYYDELILQLHLKRYDGVVGDITVTSSRSKSGDFTQPYMMAGVSMIVPIVDNQELSLWWFLKPFTWDLWLLIIALFLSKGLLVWFFERGNNNPEFERGTFLEQVETILSFSFSIFLFELWEKPKSKYSRLVVILWIVAMFILVGGYGAILQAMLSPNSDGPIVTTIEQLIINEDYVGYQKGSFVFNLLKHMGFQEEKLKAYSSIDEYATALSRGSSNNGVSAIVDEIPYTKVFLAKYADRYTMVRLTFSSSGFAYLFQRGSTIVTDVSTIILEFIEGNKMTELEKKWFGSLEPNTSPPKTPQSGRRLTTYDFRGVLLITGPILYISFLIFIVVKISKYWKTTRNPSHNEAVEGSNTEESSNNSLSRSHTDGNPANREGESDPNDTDIEAGDSSDNGHHINITPQNISDDVEMITM